MSSISAAVPTDAALTTGLESVFAARHGTDVSVELVDRTGNPYSSTFTSEVVTDIPLLRVLCKYGGSSGNDTFDHHRGVSHAGTPFLRKLSAAAAFTPVLCGTFVDDQHGVECLVLEYLDAALRLDRTPDAYDATVRAARHLGEFHAATEGGRQAQWAGVLNSYDAEYYKGWARRTAAFSAESQQSWLLALCAASASSCQYRKSSPTSSVIQ